MASINLSLNGAAIKNSYKKVLEGALPAGSPTSCLWALFSVQAPLVNAFQNSGSSESVLKVQDSGEGELSDLFEEFNDGRIQYAYIKLNDPNKNIPKRVLIAWCGSGVPERTKGYFNNYTNAITGVLQGFHTQITARSDDDLDAQAILSKVVAASGSDYSGPGVKAATSSRAPPPRTVAAKPVFTPTTSTATRSNLVASRSTRNVDNDGWGDAPPVTRTQPEKVESAYKPTKVNMAELTKQKAEPSRFVPTARRDDGGADVVKGGYQPIGKVDIAAIRAQAKKDQDDRPTPVKGAYEPVGKVDIAAIRAKAQKPTSAPQAEEESQAPKGVSDRASAFSQPAQSERLTSLPKPKVANKFGGATAFTGTKPPVPVGGTSAPAPAPVGSASRTFADQGGKTPAQLWAEKKAKERGEPVPSASASSSAPVESQKTGGEEWKSGYAGKSWAPVQTSSRFSRPEDGQEAVDVPQHEEQQPTHTGSGSVSALKDRFKGAAPMGVGAAAGVVAGAGASAAIASHEKEEEEEESAPPPVPDASRPAGGFSLPGLPSRPAAPVEEPRQEEEEYEPEPESPVRIAIPVARAPSPEETRAPPPPPPAEPEPAPVPEAAAPVADQKEGGLVAVVQFDYEKGEENEVELVEGEYVTDIDMVDEGWWAGTNARGERGLFPCNYVELVEDGGAVPHHEEPEPAPPSPARQEAAAPPPPAPAAAPPASGGPTATAIYDYEAGEDNELSFPEDAIITNLEFPDDDWWAGEYNGNIGLFPANYVRLNE